MKQKLLTVCFAFFISIFSSAQGEITMQNGTISVSDAIFTDTGGSCGYYGDNEDFTLTLCPETAGESVTLSFILYSFSTQLNLDVMTVYNGDSINSPVLLSESGGGATHNPGILIADNASGCLTINFVSDPSATTTGWISVVNTIDTASSSSFVLNWNGNGDAISSTVLGEAGGQFSFNSAPTDGAIIDPVSGVITNITPDVTYSVQYNASGANPSTTINSITVPSFPVATQPTNYIVCDNDLDGFVDFDLESKTQEILNGYDPAVYSVNYYTSEAQAISDNPDNNIGNLSSPYTNVTNPQTIYARLFCDFGNLYTITSFDLVVNTVPINPIAVDLISCDYDGLGTGVFDLTQEENQITNGNPDLTISYYLSLSDAENDTNSILQPDFFENDQPYYQTIFLRITDAITGCSYVNNNTVLYLNVVSIPITNPAPLIVNDDDGDGFAPFDLTSKDAEITAGSPGLVVTYHETEADALNNVNALTSPYINIVVNTQTIYVRVEDSTIANGCVSFVQLQLIVENVTFQINPAVIEICDINANGNGNTSIDLTSVNQTILSGLVADDYSIAYYESQNDAVAQTNPIVDAFTYNYNPNVPVIYAGVTETPTSNYEITTIDLVINQLPIANFDSDSSICDGESIVLNPNLDPNFVYQWSTGENTPTITTNIGGVYTVDILDTVTGCQGTSTIEVLSYDTPILNTPADLTACIGDAISIIDQSNNIIQNSPSGSSNYTISYHISQADANNGINQITYPSNYSIAQSQTIFIRVRPTSTSCYSVASFNIVAEDCSNQVTQVTCGIPANNNFCYGLNDTTQFTYESSDGSPLQVFFNSGLTENNFDELIILDSDGVTNLNASTPYGNNGDLTGLTFISSGSTITVGVISDGSVISCTNNPWDYTVTCIDTTAVPDCTSLSNPLNTDINVNENTDITWNTAVGLVDGYKLTIGTTSGGTDIINALDVGNVLSYTPTALAQETTYYVTIIPYNVNGDAVGCLEESFTTRSIPLPPVDVDCGSESSAYIFTEDFETDSPNGWTGTGFTGGNGDWDITVGDANSGGTGPFVSYNGNSHLEYEASGNSSTIATALSPAIDLTSALTTAELSFYMHAFGDDIGTLNVSVANTPNGPFNSVFTWSGEFQTSDTEGWLPIGVNLDAYLGQIIYIELTYGATGNGFVGDLAIDFLRVQTCGSFCIAPINILAENITENTADVSWTLSGSETEWEYVVQPAGTGEPTTSGTITTSTTVTLTGLNNDTDYEVYVRSNCGADGFSLWASLDSFTTLPQTNFTIDCTANQPTNVSFCYENNNTIQYNFTSNDGSPLTVIFNAGQVENNFDELIVLDSDGVTDLNASTPYGNTGDISGISYTSTGDSLTVFVDSDGSFNCQDNNYTSINFDVFCATNIGLIEVNAFIDFDNDGIFNNADVPFSNGYFTYEINNDGDITNVCSNTGSFIINNLDETNTYDFTFNTNSGYENCYTVPTALIENISVADGSTVVVDFPVTEIMPCEDLAVYLVPSIPPRPGFLYWNTVVIENLGLTTIASGSVEFMHDPTVTFVEVFNPPANGTITLTATGFIYTFTNLAPGESISMYADMTVPASTPLGTLLTNTLTYTTDANDLITDNNTASVTQEVIGSYDPNDITESFGPEIIYQDFVTTNEYLYYTIRFQNVGTAEAINVRIENTLDALLDSSTMQMIRASHDFVMMQQGNQLTWNFDNINLPAEIQDERGSNGYVQYKIKPTAGYNIGTIIPNTAEIYFDFNAPVITNTFTTEFVEPQLSVDEFGINTFGIYPNPADVKVEIKLNSALRGSFALSVIDIQGKQVLSAKVNAEITNSLDVSKLESGMYFIKLKNGNTELIEKLIIK